MFFVSCGSVLDSLIILLVIIVLVEEFSFNTRDLLMYSSLMTHVDRLSNYQIFMAALKAERYNSLQKYQIGSRLDITS